MQTNNKLREASEKMSNLFERGVICTSYANTAEEMEQIEELYQMAKAALAEPIKNCDVGTVEEQIDRMLEFCGRKGKCTRCEHHKIGTMFRECTLRWAQMPYEEGGAK